MKEKGFCYLSEDLFTSLLPLERGRKLNGEGFWLREILSNGEERNYMDRTHDLGRLRLSVTECWLKMGEMYLSVITHLNVVLYCASWARELLQVPSKPFLWFWIFFLRQQTQGFLKTLTSSQGLFDTQIAKKLGWHRIIFTCRRGGTVYKCIIKLGSVLNFTRLKASISIYMLHTADLYSTALCMNTLVVWWLILYHGKDPATINSDWISLLE